MRGHGRAIFAGFAGSAGRREGTTKEVVFEWLTGLGVVAYMGMPGAGPCWCMALWFGFPDKRTGFGAVGSGLCFAAERGIDRPGGFLSSLNGRGFARSLGTGSLTDLVWRKRSVGGGVSGGRERELVPLRDFGGLRFDATGFPVWRAALRGVVGWIGGSVTSSMRDQMPGKFSFNLRV